MKKSKKPNRSRNLAAEVHLARIGFARAESELKSSQEHWRVAKRRRKEAKGKDEPFSRRPPVERAPGKTSAAGGES